MTYGNKRDFPKIDLFVRRKADGPKAPWVYAASTAWARTCREAVERYQPDNGSFEVKARFAKNRAWDRP